jgi:signal-transduction protein with cAMP-binding, CBS, and nucleotidyltransferase domain
VGIEPERTIHDAAAVVDQTGVGTLVVTDRDLVRRCLAKGLLADAGTDGIMTSPGVIIDAEADLHGVFVLFRTIAVRRLGVVRGEQFVGMIPTDTSSSMWQPTSPTPASRSRARSCSLTTTVR